jgi:DNA-binding LytR/AlgR family response regulator
MRIVIIEDELFAAKRLTNMVKEYNENIVIEAWLESVNDSVDWLETNAEPDLIFLDIHLEDDLCFAIFEKITISCPIVFTTATDDLAVKAFTMKGIDYLHKPLIRSEVVAILEKYSQAGNLIRKPIGSGYFSDIFDQK